MAAKNTIEYIENDYWRDPSGEDVTRLVRTVHVLRKKPIDEFTVEDCRIMIGQNVGLEILVPIAMQYLRDDLFAEGDFYPGDLLKMVLSADEKYWSAHAELKDELVSLYQTGIGEIESIVYSDSIIRDINDAFTSFAK